MKAGAIFDMDGILFDTEKLYQKSWREIAGELKITLDEGFNSRISGSSGEIMDRILEDAYPGYGAEDIKARCRVKMQEKLQTKIRIKPGVVEILTYFKEQGYALAVASSSAREMVLSNLERTGLSSYFDYVAAKGSVVNGKPAPDIFLHAAAQIGCRPQDCYVFEDSLQGVAAGAAANCKVIMVPDLIVPTEQARKQCSGICADMQEALGQIRKGAL